MNITLIWMNIPNYMYQDAIVLDKDHYKFHEVFLNNTDLLNLNIDNFMTILSTPEHFFNQKIYIPDEIYML